MSALVALPILVPLATAVALMAAGHSRNAQRALSLTGGLALLGVSGALLARVWHGEVEVLQFGDWAAPFGISLVADLLGAIMAALSALVAAAALLYSLRAIDAEREVFGYHPLLHVLLMGINGAFLAGDLFNLYVWFEVILIASFALLVLGGGRARIRGAMGYVFINLAASVLFLVAVGLTYGATGALNLADLSLKLRALEAPGLATSLAMLFVVAFGIKAAVFPLFLWMPAAYPTLPTPVAAVFAGLLTKVGVYALIRVFTLLFTHDVEYTHGLLLAVAGLTMVAGVLGAAVQTEVRRILSFHIVSQIGFMIMGLALYTPLALAGTVLYLMHHIVVKSNLFLVGGLIERLGGSSELARVGGLYRSRPWLAALFLIPALSLAGLPPLSGFWAKLVLVRAGLETQSYLIVGTALFVGMLTLYSMTKIWTQAFWAAAPAPAPVRTGPGTGPSFPLVFPVAALAAVTLAIGLGAQPFVEVATRAADGLMDPDAYVRAVLGPQAAPVDAPLALEEGR